jgi:hypothetical protein
MGTWTVLKGCLENFPLPSTQILGNIWRWAANFQLASPDGQEPARHWSRTDAQILANTANTAIPELKIRENYDNTFKYLSIKLKLNFIYTG